METKLWSSKELAQAVTALQAGDLVAFPTETVYGLGAVAENEEAVKKVYQAKGRPSDNPLIVHVASPKEVVNYTGPLAPRTQKLMTAFWPGPLTLILPLVNTKLSSSVTGGLNTCAFRMPKQATTLQLIEKTGPLVGPSANTSGKPSPTCAAHVYHDLQGKIAGIIDAGFCQVGVESTVIDLSEPDKITILRPGKIGVEELEQVVDVPVVYDQTILGAAGRPKAPGMKYKHYSPNTPVRMIHVEQLPRIVKEVQQQKVCLLAVDAIRAQYPELASYSLGESISEAAQNLFAALRACDKKDYTCLLVQSFPLIDGLSRAYMNRLEKAAGGQWYTVGDKD